MRIRDKTFSGGGTRGDAQRGADPALCVQQRRDHGVSWAMGAAYTGRGTGGAASLHPLTHPPPRRDDGVREGRISPRGCSPHRHFSHRPNWFFSPLWRFLRCQHCGELVSSDWCRTERPRSTGTAHPAATSPAEEVWVQSRAAQVIPNCAAHRQHLSPPSFFILEPLNTDCPARSSPGDASSRGGGAAAGQRVPWVLVQPQGAAGCSEFAGGCC